MLKVVNLIYFHFLFYFHFHFYFLFLELRVRVRVTRSYCLTSVTSDDMVTVMVTNYKMYGRITLYNIYNIY